MSQLECAGKPIRMARRTSFGPNFVLEAFLRGPIDPTTGLLINLIDIDRILKQVVTNANTASAHEKLIIDLYSRINDELPATFPDVEIKLDKVKLVISEDIFLEYGT